MSTCCTPEASSLLNLPDNSDNMQSKAEDRVNGLQAAQSSSNSAMLNSQVVSAQLGSKRWSHDPYKTQSGRNTSSVISGLLDLHLPLPCNAQQDTNQNPDDESSQSDDENASRGKTGDNTTQYVSIAGVDPHSGSASRDSLMILSRANSDMPVWNYALNDKSYAPPGTRQSHFTVSQNPELAQVDINTSWPSERESANSRSKTSQGHKNDISASRSRTSNNSSTESLYTTHWAGTGMWKSTGEQNFFQEVSPNPIWSMPKVKPQPFIRPYYYEDGATTAPVLQMYSFPPHLASTNFNLFPQRNFSAPVQMPFIFPPQSLSPYRDGTFAGHVPRPASSKRTQSSNVPKRKMPAETATSIGESANSFAYVNDVLERPCMFCYDPMTMVVEIPLYNLYSEGNKLDGVTRRSQVERYLKTHSAADAKALANRSTNNLKRVYTMAPTIAVQSRFTLPSLCQLDLTGRCQQGSNCYQLHLAHGRGSEELSVETLRAQANKRIHAMERIVMMRERCVSSFPEILSEAERNDARLLNCILGLEFREIEHPTTEDLSDISSVITCCSDHDASLYLRELVFKRIVLPELAARKGYVVSCLNTEVTVDTDVMPLRLAPSEAALLSPWDYHVINTVCTKIGIDHPEDTPLFVLIPEIDAAVKRGKENEETENKPLHIFALRRIAGTQVLLRHCFSETIQPSPKSQKKHGCPEKVDRGGSAQGISAVELPAELLPKLQRQFFSEFVNFKALYADYAGRDKDNSHLRARGAQETAKDRKKRTLREFLAPYMKKQPAIMIFTSNIHSSKALSLITASGSGEEGGKSSFTVCQAHHGPKGCKFANGCKYLHYCARMK